MEIDDRPIVVSIWCLTYNHEQYIRQCLDGFVMQKTNFRFEAIVHDDASTDGTADIVREYAEKYPDIIKPIIETENLYSKQDGSLDRIMIKSCTGKYVAMCEGDDYWIDPVKLQKQVDFMERHPTCSMCFHNFDYLIESKRTPNNFRHPSHSSIVSFYDVISNPIWVFTATRLFRNQYIEAIRYVSEGCKVGDYPQAVALAISGEIGYINEVMCVYRQSQSNNWSASYKKKNYLEKQEHFKNITDMLRRANAYSNNKYNKDFKKAIDKIESGLFFEYRDYAKLRKLCYRRFFSYSLRTTLFFDLNYIHCLYLYKIVEKFLCILYPSKKNNCITI